MVSKDLTINLAKQSSKTMIITQAILTATKRMTKITKVTFHLTSLTQDDELRLEQMRKAPGWLLFSHDEIKQRVEEVMKTRTIGIDREHKSPSEILRGLIFRYWSELYKGGQDFPTYYKMVMDQIINTIDNKYNAEIYNRSNAQQR